MNRNPAEVHLGLKFQFGHCKKMPHCHTQKDTAYRHDETSAIITALHPSALHRQ